MKPYPLSKELEAAMERLYPGEDTGRLAIGIVGVSPAARQPPADPNTPYEDRVQELVKTLECWVDLNARQLEEFEGEYDETRLKFEARAWLLVLRELHRLFPEVVV